MVRWFLVFFQGKWSNYNFIVDLKENNNDGYLYFPKENLFYFCTSKGKWMAIKLSKENEISKTKSNGYATFLFFRGNGELSEG